MDSQYNASSGWLDKPLASFLPKINIETGLMILILAAAIFTRFYNVGERVMSHDEVNHVVPSYNLYSGQGYAYDPVTHGPLQFHLVALSFFLLGDSDFSARVPAVLFSIATVAVALFSFRRYLGRKGALIAGFMMLISPYMLFYGRYTRNEAFGGLWTLLMIYGALRYMEKGDKASLYLLTVVMALHFTDKATAFIYNAQLMLFMGFTFLYAALKLPWKGRGTRDQFLISMIGAVILLGGALGIAVVRADQSNPATSDIPGAASAGLTPARIGEILMVGLAVLLAIYALYLLVRSMGWKMIRRQRSFDLIILAGTLTLPQLAAFPERMIGWDPLDYTTGGMLKTTILVVLCSLLAIAIGLWWRPKFWVGAAAIFFTIFTVFYTTFFTNGKGFFMGLVAALGYWLSQQGVQRGSQPLYYYALIQIPIYEYLPAIGAIVALIIGWRKRLFTQLAGIAPAHQPDVLPEEMAAGELTSMDGELPESNAAPAPELEVPERLPEEGEDEDEPQATSRWPAWLHDSLTADRDAELAAAGPPQRVPVLALLLFWSFSALVAYSLAGEKMPWLTVHITAGMILAAGWGFGYLVETTHWKELGKQHGVFVLLLLPVWVASISGFLVSLLGAPGPFTSNTLEGLNATSNFMLGAIGLVASSVAIFYLLSTWPFQNIFRLLLLAFFGFLAILTARTAFTAAYIHYDQATEFLVYAHAARGPKEVLAQVEEISKRTTGGLDIEVAYDNETLYPYWWYFRHYPNKLYYADNPTKDVANAPLILVGDPNYSKIEPIVKDNYVSFEYKRLWWPMQDYFGLTWERIWNAIKDPSMRQALFDIWLNRDYTLYAQITGNKNLTLDTWVPSANMRFYIRKDIVAQMWNYGASPSVGQTVTSDPYAQGMVLMTYDRVIGSVGTNPGQFNAPRGVAVAPDGTLYVADSRNNRIQHLTPDGKVLQSWGTFADVSKGNAPGGTFYEPWGVAVGKDGSVYVTDTWNHRVQKFTADGQFVKMWGYFGQAEKPDAFWGPRGIAVDSQGRVFVVDTGNKRVVVFSADGNPITSFGGSGYQPGQFDEPVGIAFDSAGLVYITDTWNQRIQVFQPDATGMTFLPLRQWDVSAWYGQSLDNKPFIAVDGSGNVYITDPDGGRVLQFSSDGKFLRGWTNLNGDIPSLVMPAGVAVDAQGGLWVTDASANHLFYFNLPQVPLPTQAQPTSSSQQQIGPQASPTATSAQ